MIISPMPTGSGAYIVHKTLERKMDGYRVIPYNPYLTLLPPVLYAVGRSCRADLIHTTPDYGVFHARRGIPLVLTFHGYTLDIMMRGYNSLLQNIHYRTDLKWFTQQAVKRAQVITTVSRFTAGLVGRELNIGQPIKVIYNGIDQNRFYPARRPGWSDDKIKVLFSGNLTRKKGAHWLLPILESLAPNIHIFYTSGLRTKSKLSNHDRLHCLGAIGHEDMPAIYNDMDILLFPTVREGLSLAAIEAMACGMPLVATDCSSFPELVDSGKGGYLCPLGDVDAFAEKINVLAENASLRREMGGYNRAKVEQLFTLERMAKGYADLFEEVLS